MKRIFAVVQAMLLFQLLAFAQNTASHEVKIGTPEFALLSIEQDGDNPHLRSEADPAIAVQYIQLSGSQEHECWINYSSLVKGGNQSRKVVASLIGSIPEGVSVSVEASGYSGSGKGKTGIPSGKKQLTGHPEEIISSIGNCYTGKGNSNGHLIRLTIEIHPEETDITPVAGDLMVTYRITE
jgi:hypothetical protein